MKDAQFQGELQNPASAEPEPQRDGTKSPAQANWSHVITVARRAARDDGPSSSEEEDKKDDDHLGQEADPSTLSADQRSALKRRRQEARDLGKRRAKMMELQYWLEFVDAKHRHGSNLRKYHQHWQMQDTTQNFFYWLDQGDGKHLDLPECTRERLDTQQVRYLSREERQNYLVEVDAEGRLIWAKNNQKVWTKDECKFSIFSVQRRFSLEKWCGTQSDIGCRIPPACQPLTSHCCHIPGLLYIRVNDQPSATMARIPD